MGIGNMFNRLLNNESKEEKDERLNISEENKTEEVSDNSNLKPTVDEVVAKETPKAQPEPAGEITEEKEVRSCRKRKILKL